MTHISGQSRYQVSLFPEVLDDVVAADHPVRVIDAFVDTLDLRALGFARVVAAETGRPGYRPGDLLKLYVYGYLHQIRSSRRLEREARRNVEVMWLLERLVPSFKTIADFRRDHAAAIVEVCRAFIRFCRGQALFGGELAALDGTKVWAAASRKTVITPKKLAKVEAALADKIAAHLAAMDAADQSEGTPEAADPEAAENVAAALVALQAQRDAVQAQAAQLAEAGLKQRVVGEDEARLMRTARHGHQVAYNAQVAVDCAHKLIVAFELTNECNDERQLQPMAAQAKAALGVEQLTVVADTGYSNGEQGADCAAAQITAIVPRPQTVNPKGKAYFTREQFSYEPDSDTYRCPAGETLSCRKISYAEQKKDYWTTVCKDCALKAQCTGAAKRTIVRSFHEGARQAMHERALADPKWMQLRRCLVEHPFGTIKAMMGSPRFLVRGLTKARGEWALGVLCYNLKRAIRILGVPRLLQVLQTSPP